MENVLKFNYAQLVLCSNGMNPAAFRPGQFFFLSQVIIIQSWWHLFHLDALTLKDLTHIDGSLLAWEKNFSECCILFTSGVLKLWKLRIAPLPYREVCGADRGESRTLQIFCPDGEDPDGSHHKSFCIQDQEIIKEFSKILKILSPVTDTTSANVVQNRSGLVHSSQLYQNHHHSDIISGWNQV